MFVNGMVGINPEQTKKANEIKVACYNNLAAVNLKEGKLNRVIDCSTKVKRSQNFTTHFALGNRY